MSTLTKQDTFIGLLDTAPNNFSAARTLAKESYLSQGIPVAKAEEYKFTNIGKKLEQNISNIAPALPFEVTSEMVHSATFAGFEGDLLVFANGKFLPELSSKIEGVEVSLISEKVIWLLAVSQNLKRRIRSNKSSLFRGWIVHLSS